MCGMSRQGREERWQGSEGATKRIDWLGKYSCDALQMTYELPTLFSRGQPAAATGHFSCTTLVEKYFVSNFVATDYLADMVVVQNEERKGHEIPHGIVLLIINMLAFCGHACHLSLSSWQL
jgi:hypothetical protein